MGKRPGSDRTTKAYVIFASEDRPGSSFEATDAPSTVFERSELTIQAFEVDHSPVAPSVGYRVDYRGRSVVISGDTTASPSLIEAAQGADLLLHEALAPHIVRTIEDLTRAGGDDRLAQVMFDIRDYHTSPVAAAEAANEAQVGRFVLYHLVPGPPASSAVAARVFLRGVSDVRPDVTLAVDGSLFVLPVGSDEIEERVAGD